MTEDEKFIKLCVSLYGQIDHDVEKCGTCYHRQLMYEEALAIEVTGDYENAIDRWADSLIRRWRDSKYYKLFVEESDAGRDWHEAFKTRGWQI